MRIFKEEIFGPISIIVPYSSEAEAINIANSTEYGLASYLFTQQLSRAYRVAESLDFGLVGINDTAISAPQAPFGGIKASGIGREGGHFGIEEYLAIKYLHLAI
jgi:succinate-semialdehyde dehydrogenase/glutarate-semialdehyde dehydrogenase